ncbi:hypothetical protein ACSBR1_024178 [Camellia fascicularis]
MIETTYLLTRISLLCSRKGFSFLGKSIDGNEYGSNGGLKEEVGSPINVAAWYRPNDFFERRDRIAEKLYVRQPIKGCCCGTLDDDDSLDMDLNDGDVDWLNEIVSELVKDFALDTEEELGGDYVSVSASEIDHHHHPHDLDLPIPIHSKGKQLSLVQNALLQSPKRKRSTESENKKDEQCSVPQAIAKCPRQSTEISKISEPAKAKVKEHKSTFLNDAEAYELKMEATKRKLQQRYKQIERAKKKIRVVQAERWQFFVLTHLRTSFPLCKTSP